MPGRPGVISYFEGHLPHDPVYGGGMSSGSKGPVKFPEGLLFLARLFQKNALVVVCVTALWIASDGPRGWDFRLKKGTGIKQPVCPEDIDPGQETGHGQLCAREKKGGEEKPGCDPQKTTRFLFRNGRFIF